MSGGSTIGDSSFSAFVDLTARPDSIRIDEGPIGAGYSLHVAPYEVGAHLSLYLSRGSLEALRDVIATRLGEDAT